MTSSQEEQQSDQGAEPDDDDPSLLPEDLGSTILPIRQHASEILAALETSNCIILISETGSGKSTQIGQILYDAAAAKATPANPLKKIVMTQPRRVATIAVAERVAEEMNLTVGKDLVGYKIRFQTCLDRQKTKLIFMTDGMLIQQILADPDLSSYGTIVLDEAHERSLSTDILFGLLKHILQRNRSLKLVITSATLDQDKFSHFFNECPVISIPGRTFPVDIYHSSTHELIMGKAGPVNNYVQAAIDTALELHFNNTAQGHILVFLTGKEEIERACRAIREGASARARARQPPSEEGVKQLQVYPLYGALQGHQQAQVFERVDLTRRRKIIVSTNLAETSLTIEDIGAVIDTGFMKHKVYDPSRGMDALIVVPISKVSAQQRAGRAGRTRAGVCYRLYSKTAYEDLMDESIPEIKRCNLVNTILHLKVLGITDVLGFEYVDMPRYDSLCDGLLQLYHLSALDGSTGTVTPLGREMSYYPLIPSLSRTLLRSLDLNVSTPVMKIIAMLSVENLYLNRPRAAAGARRSFSRHAAESSSASSSSSYASRTEREDDERWQQRYARQAILVHPRGDHLTYLAIFRAWEERLFIDRRQEEVDWCDDRALNRRSLQMALKIYQQLVQEVASRRFKSTHESSGVSTSSSTPETHHSFNHEEEEARICQSFCAGFASQVARRSHTRSSFYTSVPLTTFGPVATSHPTFSSASSLSPMMLQVHPTSVYASFLQASALQAVHHSSPGSSSSNDEVVLYHELIATSRRFMRHVLRVNLSWLHENYTVQAPEIDPETTKDAKVSFIVCGETLSGRPVPDALRHHLVKKRKRSNGGGGSRAASGPTLPSKGGTVVVPLQTTLQLARARYLDRRADK